MYLVTFYPWWTNNRNNKQHFNVLTTEQRRHTHTHTAYLFCVLVHKVSSTLQLIIKRQQVNSPPANQSERGGGGGGEQPIRSQLWFTECPKNPAERFCEREDIRPVWQHFSADFKLREKTTELQVQTGSEPRLLIGPEPSTSYSRTSARVWSTSE